MPSQNIGTLVGSTIRPFSEESKIATALSNEIKGGLHSVSSISERNSIITERRQFGMIVYVKDNNNYYQLREVSSSNLYDNSNWDELNIISESLDTNAADDWQNSVKSFSSSYSVSPSVGDRYLISSGLTYDWAGHDGEIAQWSSSGWLFTLPHNGMVVRIDSDYGAYYVYEGEYPIGSWIYYSNDIVAGTGITISLSGTVPTIGINLISATGINVNLVGNDYELEYSPTVYNTTNSELVALVASSSLVPGWIYNVTDVGSQNDLSISLVSLGVGTISFSGHCLGRYIEYDIDNNWITKMSDNKGNEVSCSYDNFLVLGHDPYLSFDWDSATIFGNKIAESLVYLRDISGVQSGTTFSGTLKNCNLNNMSFLYISNYLSALNSIQNFNLYGSSFSSKYSDTHKYQIDLSDVSLLNGSTINVFNDIYIGISDSDFKNGSILNSYASASSSFDTITLEKLSLDTGSDLNINGTGSSILQNGNLSINSSLNITNSTFSYFSIGDNYTYSIVNDTITEFYVDKRTRRYHTESYTSSVISISFTFSNPHYVGITGSSAKSVNLPDGSVDFNGSSNDGRVIIIKDESGNCAVYPITITPYSGQKIDNSGTSSVLASNNGSLSLLYRGGNWWII